MTRVAIAGGRVAYYPEGRGVQRPQTLAPSAGEDPPEVVASLRTRSGELTHAWGALDDGAWDQEILEPDDNPDLGPIPLSGLPLLRLTELEVHGSDLGLGLEWSDLFVREALPARLRRLNVRRTNHRPFDRTLSGTWLLVSVDGPTFMVSVHDDTVDSHPADPDSAATASIEGTSRDLLALLLGRPAKNGLRIRGDVRFGEAFSAAFPGP